MQVFSRTGGSGCAGNLHVFELRRDITMHRSSPAASTQAARHPRTSARKLSLLFAGPELLAEMFNRSLLSQPDLEVLTPLTDIRNLVDILVRRKELGQPVDLVILYWRAMWSQDISMRTLSALNKYRQRCLVLIENPFSEVVEQIRQAGASGYLSAASSFPTLLSVLHMLTADRSATYFPPLAEPALAESAFADEPLVRRLHFHRDRLQRFTEAIGWELNKKEIDLIGSFDQDSSVLAEQMKRSTRAIDHDFSQRIYPFLRSLSGKEVKNRLDAFQVLLEYGILEYAVP
jgi:DNA-binding NarL/FixJ family response regulator